MTKDEIKNILITKARDYYGQIEFAKMAKGQTEILDSAAEKLLADINAEIDLAVDELQYELTPLEDDINEEGEGD